MARTNMVSVFIHKQEDPNIYINSISPVVFGNAAVDNSMVWDVLYDMYSNRIFAIVSNSEQSGGAEGVVITRNICNGANPLSNLVRINITINAGERLKSASLFGRRLYGTSAEAFVGFSAFLRNVTANPNTVRHNSIWLNSNQTNTATPNGSIAGTATGFTLTNPMGRVFKSLGGMVPQETNYNRDNIQLVTEALTLSNYRDASNAAQDVMLLTGYSVSNTSMTSSISRDAKFAVGTSAQMQANATGRHTITVGNKQFFTTANAASVTTRSGSQLDANRAIQTHSAANVIPSMSGEWAYAYTAKPIGYIDEQENMNTISLPSAARTQKYILATDAYTAGGLTRRQHYLAAASTFTNNSLTANINQLTLGENLPADAQRNIKHIYSRPSRNIEAYQYLAGLNIDYPNAPSTAGVVIRTHKNNYILPSTILEGFTTTPGDEPKVVTSRVGDGAHCYLLTSDPANGVGRLYMVF